MTNYVFETLTNEEFVAQIHEMLTALEAENKRLREALEVYADVENWNTTAWYWIGNPHPTQTASDALDGDARRKASVLGMV